VASAPDVAAANTADDVPSAIGVPTISGVTTVVFDVPEVYAFPAVNGFPVVVAINSQLPAFADTDITAEL
jgi:hypothetical protein